MEVNFSTHFFFILTVLFIIEYESDSHRHAPFCNELTLSHSAIALTVLFIIEYESDSHRRAPFCNELTLSHSAIAPAFRRDSFDQTGGSFASVASPLDDVQSIMSTFKGKRFTEKEMVSLLAAHTIGSRSFEARLSNLYLTGNPDPIMGVPISPPFATAPPRRKIR